MFDGGITIVGGFSSSQHPRSYINYILFDESMAFLDAGFSRIGNDDYNRELVELNDIYIPENGYFYAYISYENDASGEPVWWDNFKVTHVSSGAIQRDDYYPMGLRHNKTVADNNINNYLYNGGTELNTTTGLYMTPFRRYSLSPTEGWRNPATGRFNGIDLPVRNSTVGRVEAGAMASSFSSMTPYQYAFNNPISFNDPTGLCPTCDDNIMQMPEWANFEDAMYSIQENISALGDGIREYWFRNDDIATPTSDYFLMSSNDFAEKYNVNFDDIHNLLSSGGRIKKSGGDWGIKYTEGEIGQIYYSDINRDGTKERILAEVQNHWFFFGSTDNSYLVNPTGFGIRSDSGGDGAWHAWRDDKTRLHKGIDFQSKIGQPVFSPISGRVKNIIGHTSKKPMVQIYPNDTTLGFDLIEILYVGLPKGFQLNANRSIKAGEIIGTTVNLQNLGYPSNVGQHVHLQMYLNKVKINPTSQLSKTN